MDFLTDINTSQLFLRMIININSNENDNQLQVNKNNTVKFLLQNM